jgi:type II secretory pathway component PulK
MLTVTLVATLAATALWQQWRSVEVEAAERTRVQSTWLLTGALDWARLILRQDASAGGADHLAEPWAVPLQEARLSTFLSMDSSSADADRDAFLSGQITDLQGTDEPDEPDRGRQVVRPRVASTRPSVRSAGSAHHRAEPVDPKYCWPHARVLKAR